MIFLDLNNAFGFIPHDLLWAAFSCSQIPKTIAALVESYDQDFEFCSSTPEFTYSWHLGHHASLKVGCRWTVSWLLSVAFWGDISRLASISEPTQKPEGEHHHEG